MSTTQDVSYQQQNTFHLFREYLDRELGEIRTTIDQKHLTGEMKATLERMQTAMNLQQQHLQTIARQQSQPLRTLPTWEEPEAKERKAAFNRALRAGGPHALSTADRRHVRYDHEDPQLASLETKAMYASDNTTGGFLTVPELVQDLVKAITLISPMRDVVAVRETMAPYVLIPKRTQTASAYRIAEQATRVESQNPRFGQIQIYPYEAAALVLVSRTDLDDAELDLGQFLMQEFAEQFAKLEGAELINGDGSAKAQGFLQNINVTTDLGQVTTTGPVGALDYASFPKLLHSVKSAYRTSDAAWLFTTDTLGAIRQLTDTQGRPLWMPFGSNDIPNQIFGYKYVEMPDMPQIATGNFPVAFGNFKKGYQMVVRKQVSVTVLQERYADQNLVGYLGYYRMGGATVLPEAIKLLKVH